MMREFISICKDVSRQRDMDTTTNTFKEIKIKTLKF